MLRTVLMSENRTVGFGFFVFIIFISFSLLTCDPEEDPNEYQKKIIVTDSDPDYGFSVKKIGKDNYILMALAEKKPNVSDISPADYINSNIALGKPRGKDINLTIYTSFVEYWIGKGSYWVIFVELNSSATYAYKANVSKEKVNFDTIQTYLTNEDFMLPVILESELGNLLEKQVEGIL
ncbi:MAG: hypothetical protein Ta2B_01230 [Termitinemataceae bacterium]|nr:MAG: hypothetical protein Ta2B_01230 [Termitinemataceae bacterium]